MGEQPPRSLNVEVTTLCNRACDYCYNVWKTDSDYQGDELSATELLSLTKNVLRSAGLTHVQLSGGEPLLRPDLFEIIEGLVETGVAVSLVTDGGLIDDDVAAKLAQLRVGPIQPTLLAADRDLHNSIKGTDSFDATVEAIARLRHYRVPVSVAFVCTSRNAHHFREVVELCFALGVKLVAFNRLCIAGQATKNRKDLMPTREMIVSCLDTAEWANTKLEMKVSVAISLPLCVTDRRRHPHVMLGTCALNSANPGFTLDCFGNLRACSISPTILGDLRKDSWEQIIARSQNRYFEKMATPPDACLDCPAVSHCGGGCRESTLAHYGTLNRPDPLVG